MKWEKVKLGDLYNVHNGLSKGSKFFGSGYPFLTFSTVFNNFFIPNELTALVQSTEKEQESFSIKRGDVFITRTSETMDELGMSCVALKSYDKATYNGFTKRLRPVNPNIILPEYIGYYLRTSMFRGLFKAFSSMTTRASLKNEDLLKMEVLLPPLPVQTKIANILSAYDDLIENNQKQIKLLEEASQRLYKEWFVYLRFPGHENVKIVDGVPEGWEKQTIDDLADYINGFAFKPSDWGMKGKPIIKIREMVNGIKDDTPRNIGDAIPKKYIVKSGDVLFSWSATLTAMIWTAEDGLLNQHIFKVVPKENLPREFVLQSILFTLEEFKNLTTGSTMKHIQRGKLKEVVVLIPSKSLLEKYNSLSESIRNNILNLSRKVNLLQEARDRLLNRLMSGELEVE